MACLQLLAGCALGSVGMCGIRAEFVSLKPAVVNIIIFVICGTSLQVLLPRAVLFGLQCPCPVVPSRMFPEQWLTWEEVSCRLLCLFEIPAKTISPLQLKEFQGLSLLNIKCASALMFSFTGGWVHYFGINSGFSIFHLFHSEFGNRIWDCSTWQLEYFTEVYR